MMNNGALKGIKVLDVSRLLPGPYCSMILADHGAEVVSVEDRRYKGDGHYLAAVNRNKRHISLDLKTDEGREIFFRLAEDADVVLEGFRPGVAERLGIDYESVRKVNPEVIYCSITGYGQSGSLKERAGHDVNYMSRSGALSLIGEAGRSPCIPGIQFADMAGGSMNGAIGILMALFARQRTGKGQYVEISMTDGMIGFLPVAQFFHELTGTFPERGNNLLSHRYAFYNTYETADGRHLSVGALEPRFWARLCEHLGVPEFIPLQYDEKKREEIIDTLKAIFKTKPRDAWSRELAELDACCEPVLGAAEVLADPHFREREMVVTVAKGDCREATAIGVPVKLSGTPGAIRTPPVSFGENTREVLEGLGYSEEAIDRLIAKGVI